MVVPSVTQSLSEPDDRFISYQLKVLEGMFIFDPETKTVTLLVQEQPVIVEQQRFTDQEFDILKTLFDQHPEYCPLAELLAAQSARSLPQCRTEVMRALDEGCIDEIIRPVRNLLHRARIKLRRFGLDVRSIQETGYLLVPDRNGFKRPRNEQ
jgi:DNA-binding response OmpR family regulator